mgnify:FL=1
MKSALIIGGTRGIGRATAQLLLSRGWKVNAVGRQGFDIHITDRSRFIGDYDAFIFSAGDVRVMGSLAFDYPIAFYQIAQSMSVNCIIIAISSVAADRPAKSNPHYAAAKAALESYARTLKFSSRATQFNWRVETIRFDLVRTEMLNQLPQSEKFEGREIIDPEEAARRIVERLE